MATVVGRIVFTIDRWFTDGMAVYQRGAGRVKYIFGVLGLLMAPFLLPLVALAALVFIVSAAFSNNTGGSGND